MEWLLYRYAATGFSSLLTYAIAWVLLSAGSNAVTTDDLGPGDSDSFRVGNYKFKINRKELRLFIRKTAIIRKYFCGYNHRKNKP